MAGWATKLERRLAGEADLLVVRTLAEMAAVRRACDTLALERHGRFARVGFVPTMGALHDGHLSLLDVARAGALNDGRSSRVAPPSDVLVASIFVNPTQFAPTEDLSKYPRTWELDLERLRRTGTAVVFAPTAVEMYPPASPFRTFVTLTGIDEGSPEGAARPGFFRGVATVVTKLFNAVQPTDAYFGQKDGIQCVVLRTSSRDLGVPIRIHVGHTVRECDGLAMSSRNVYLSSAQRQAAPAIYKALSTAAASLAATAAPVPAELAQLGRRSGPAHVDPATAERMAQQAALSHSAQRGQGAAASEPLSPQLVQAAARIRADIASEREFGEVQYVTFSDGATGQPLARMEDSTARNGAVLLSVAAKIGSTRLLDNVVIRGVPNDLGWPATHPPYSWGEGE